jgi:hypothetical protein
MKDPDLFYPYKDYHEAKLVSYVFGILTGIAGTVIAGLTFMYYKGWIW